MSAALGTHPVCTNPTTCPAGQAVSTPIPLNESWHYAVGHWVDPPFTEEKIWRALNDGEEGT